MLFITSSIYMFLEQCLTRRQQRKISILSCIILSNYYMYYSSSRINTSCEEIQMELDYYCKGHRQWTSSSWWILHIHIMIITDVQLLKFGDVYCRSFGETKVSGTRFIIGSRTNVQYNCASAPGLVSDRTLFNNLDSNAGRVCPLNFNFHHAPKKTCCCWR